MPELVVVHTADLDSTTRLGVRRFLEVVFEGDLSADEWENGLGGLHALLWDGDELIGHGSVVQRQLIHRGKVLRTGYVENVGVLADRRAQGHGRAVMNALERVIEAAYQLGALGASDDAAGFYVARGWRRWLGPTSVLSPEGIRSTPEEDGAIHVFPTSASLDLAAELTCDWREGDPW